MIGVKGPQTKASSSTSTPVDNSVELCNRTSKSSDPFNKLSDSELDEKITEWSLLLSKSETELNEVSVKSEKIPITLLWSLECVLAVFQMQLPKPKWGVEGKTELALRRKKWKAIRSQYFHSKASRKDFLGLFLSFDRSVMLSEKIFDKIVRISENTHAYHDVSVGFNAKDCYYGSVIGGHICEWIHSIIELNRRKRKGLNYLCEHGLMAELSEAVTNTPEVINKYFLLHSCCTSGQIETALWLLSFPGESINLKNETENNYTPLHTSCLNNQVEMVKVILNFSTSEDGVMVDSLASDGSTALHIAISRGHFECGKVCQSII